MFLKCYKKYFSKIQINFNDNNCYVFLSALSSKLISVFNFTKYGMFVYLSLVHVAIS